MPPIQIKRSDSKSNPPSSLLPGELAWTEATKTLYLGTFAQTVIPIAGNNTGFAINAAWFGARGNLVTTKLTYEKEGYVSGADDTAALQAALTFAGNLAQSNVSLEQEGNVVCYVPPGLTGKYRITAQLVIPPNVVFHCEGFIYNFLPDPHQPMILGDRHSHCRKLQVHCNGNSGVDWGRPGSDPCASNLESIVIWHAGVGFNPSEPATRQKCGLRLYGLDFRIGNLWIKGGNIGWHGSGASDVLAANVFLIGCANALAIQSGEQWSLPSVCIDTNITSGISIDNSNNIEIKARAFVNSDAYGTAMQYGVIIGRYTGAKRNSNIEIEYAAQSTGGYGIEIGNCEGFKGRFFLTNARTYSQSNGGGTATSHWTPTNTGGLLAHDIGTFYFLENNVPKETVASAIKYTGNYGRCIDIEVTLDDGILLTEGTPYGTLVSRYPGVIVSPNSVTGLSRIASEALFAGAFVNFWNNNGVESMRLANAANNRPAHAFVAGAIAAGTAGLAVIAQRVLNNQAQVVGGAVISTGDYYLSGTEPGKISRNLAVEGSGQLNQKVAIASGRDLIVALGEPQIRG